MRIPVRPRRHGDDERLLPLINVVFLLLIFFMLLGRISASDPFAVAPPRSDAAAATAAREIVVLMAADGRLALDGVETGEAELRDALARRLADRPAAPVWLKADGDAGGPAVVAVMEAMRDAGVERLRLLTVAPR